MATLLTFLCIKFEQHKLIPIAQPLGFFIDFLIFYFIFFESRNKWIM